MRQFPRLKALPKEHSTLMRSPWFQSPSQALGLGINARHLRYHYSLWNDLKPKTLRGVFTTLVYVTPQLGFSLTPHIKLDRVFRYFGALSRYAGPAQLFPAGYLYPDAKLQGLEKVPAAMFADVLPNLGSSFPVMDETPNVWDIVVRLNGPDCYYGYPFARVSNPVEDVTLSNAITGSMTLPNGKLVQARKLGELLLRHAGPQAQGRPQAGARCVPRRLLPRPRGRHPRRPPLHAAGGDAVVRVRRHPDRLGAGDGSARRPHLLHAQDPARGHPRLQLLPADRALLRATSCGS